MKKILLKISVIFLFLSLMGAGCEKDEELLWEISPNSKTAVIQKEVDGIEFKFCLLNEKGEPATVFNEGENFTFQFVIKNNLDTTIIFDNSLFYVSGFCELKNGKENLGSSFKIVGIADIGDVAFSISPGMASTWEVLWIPENDEWSKGFVSYKRNNLQYLPKGEYYTKFSHRFNLGVVKTDLITFKINFKIS